MTTCSTIRAASEGEPKLVLVLQYPERAILQTQRQIAHEAAPEILQQTKACGPVRLLVHHQHLSEIVWVLHRLRYAHATDQPLLMEEEHRNICDAMDDQRGCVDNMQVQMWSRLASLYTNENIEIGVSRARQVRRHTLRRGTRVCWKHC